MGPWERAVSEPDRLLSADALEARVYATMAVRVKHIWSCPKRPLGFCTRQRSQKLQEQFSCFSILVLTG